jgi:LysM repeat protein
MRRLSVMIAALMLVLAFGVTASQSSSAQGDSQVVHVVQPGENLYRISLRYGVSIGAIQTANNISNPNLIFAGQQLIISGASAPPPDDGGDDDGGDNDDGGTPSTYTVRSGDYLSAIARRFGTTAQAIAVANNIANPNLIFPGQVLQIPGGTVTPPPDDGGDEDDPPVVNPPPPPSGGFAVGAHVQSFEPLGVMRDTGMTWVKKQVRWSQGQDTGTSANFIRTAKDAGFQIVLGVVGDPGQLGANRAQYIQDYANYLGQVAALGPDAIEVWNEPNIDREWPTGQISGAAYTEMLRASYNAIKAANPNVLVISGAPSPTGAESAFPGSVVNDDNFLRQMRNAGAANVMDCVGIHYNEGVVPPTARSGDPRGNSSYYTRYYPAMVDVYSSIFPGKPLCFTELGYLTGEGFGPLPAGFTWAADTTLAEQEQWLGQVVSLARGDSRVRMLIVWNMNFSQYEGDPQAGYAIIRPDGNCYACDNIRAALG